MEKKSKIKIGVLLPSQSKGTPKTDTNDSVPLNSIIPLAPKEMPQNVNDLKKYAEVLRQRLVQLYYTEGSFSSLAVLELSQQLDEYIVAIQSINSCNR